jgi:DNA polymerase-4
VILHSDLNNFYASVECLYNPDIRNKPVAVCGSQSTRHGIVLAKNYIAKKYNIKTGEPIWEAKKKCPNLVIVRPNYILYLKFSKLAIDIYKRYTDLIEPFGIDECWLDVTNSVRLFGDGVDIAYKIKEEIKEELGVTASVGVSYNKIFAKLGSDMKKPDAVTEITEENFKDIVWPLPVNNLMYVGHSTKV